MRRQAIVGALLIVGVGVVLGATVFRSGIAQATGLAQSVTVDNTSANPVPVQEQGAAPITDGGDGSFAVTGQSQTIDPPAVASAISITLGQAVNSVVLRYQGHVTAVFFGPAGAGHSNIDLAFTRPVKFDEFTCMGEPAQSLCQVGWVGDLP